MANNSTTMPQYMKSFEYTQPFHISRNYCTYKQQQPFLLSTYVSIYISNALISHGNSLQLSLFGILS